MGHLVTLATWCVAVSQSMIPILEKDCCSLILIKALSTNGLWILKETLNVSLRVFGKPKRPGLLYVLVRSWRSLVRIERGHVFHQMVVKVF
jgi:hypothetical protein